MKDNLELRKAILIATGWQLETTGFLYHPMRGRFLIESCPEVEKDDGMAIKLLDKICRDRELHWNLGDCVVNGSPEVTHRVHLMKKDWTVLRDIHGTAVAIACCKAIVEAAQL